MNLRPVMMDKIVSGQIYTEVEVCVGGSMLIDHHVFCGQPLKEHDGWWIREKGYSENRSLSDAGMCVGKHYDNFHRTFRYTGKNEVVLKDLVARQALDEYLALIGISNPEEVAASVRSRQPVYDYFD